MFQPNTSINRRHIPKGPIGRRSSSFEILRLRMLRFCGFAGRRRSQGSFFSEKCSIVYHCDPSPVAPFPPSSSSIDRQCSRQRKNWSRASSPVAKVESCRPPCRIIASAFVTMQVVGVPAPDIRLLTSDDQSINVDFLRRVKACIARVSRNRRKHHVPAKHQHQPPPHPEGPQRRTLLFLRNSAVAYAAVLRFRRKKTNGMVVFRVFRRFFRVFTPRVSRPNIARQRSKSIPPPFSEKCLIV
jgi:hypothetical protein